MTFSFFNISGFIIRYLFGWTTLQFEHKELNFFLIYGVPEGKVSRVIPNIREALLGNISHGELTGQVIATGKNIAIGPHCYGAQKHGHSNYSPSYLKDPRQLRKYPS